jgi:Zn finger protein HypA/HybF involved in hydrogenase expression
VLERFPLACPECGAPDVEIVDGTQLSVEALEVIAEDPVYEEAR